MHTKQLLQAVAVLLACLALPAADAAVRDLFVTDFSADVVRRYDGNTGAFISNFASAGGLDSPRGLAFGTDGMLYVNSSRFTSRKVLKYDGTTGSWRGSLVDNVSYEDLYLAPDGNFYMTGPNTSTITLYKHNATTGAGGQIVSISSFGGGAGVTMGPDGLLYMAIFNCCRVERYNTSGGGRATFASGLGINSLGGLAFGPDGHLYASGGISGDLNNGGRVFKIHGQTGQLLDTLGGTGAPFAGPTDLEFGPDGFIYVPTSGIEKKIVRIDPVTGVSSNFVTPGSGGLSFPWNIAFTPGPIYTPPADPGNGNLVRMAIPLTSNPDGGTAEAIDLGTLHGLSAVASGGEVTKSNSVARDFVVNEDAAGPAEVFINALLEGQLNTDGGGTASVMAKVSVLDGTGVLIDEAIRSFHANSAAGSPDNVAVNTAFALSLSLTAGQTYELVTELQVTANDNGGTAEALFDQTFEVAFGETAVPEPASLALCVIGCLSFIRGRRETPRDGCSSRSRV